MNTTRNDAAEGRQMAAQTASAIAAVEALADAATLATIRVRAAKLDARIDRDERPPTGDDYNALYAIIKGGQ